MTLDFERLKREKLEADLDKCRDEIVRLINTIRSYEERIASIQVRILREIDGIEHIRMFLYLNLVTATQWNHTC